MTELNKTKQRVGAKKSSASSSTLTPRASLAHLRPFVSILMFEVEKRKVSLNAFLSDLAAALCTNDEAESGKSQRKAVLAALVNATSPSHGIDVGFVHYTEIRQTAWTADPAIRDSINQLALVALRKGRMALLLTESSRAAAVGKVAGGHGLRPVAPAVLNAAFATGAARTLWLSGIHARTNLKPDSKVLIGADLRDALDPLGDQTYYFTALRAVKDLGASRMTIGLAPEKARVWTGPSKDLATFLETLHVLFTALEVSNKPLPQPMDVLAIAEGSALGGGPNVKSLNGAFDLSLVSPESLVDEIDEAEREALQRWSDEGRFDLAPGTGPDFVAAVSLGNQAMGDVVAVAGASLAGRVKFDVKSSISNPGEDLQDLLKLLRKRRYLQIRYESGHTISDGIIYSPRLRDVRFEQWQWLDLAGFNIDEEKPTKMSVPKPKKAPRPIFDPTKVGKEHSLFCWVWNNWPHPAGKSGARGWLACDDGSGEKADFIHLDEIEKRLTLIHVKGSSSNKPARGISVVDYELVTSQAVKNLWWVDRQLVAANFSSFAKQIGSLVLHDGQLSSRSAMQAALTTIGGNVERRVVILQPNVSKSAHEAARADQDAGKKTGGAPRLRQLETLLVAARLSCMAVGADLLVYGER